MPIFSPARSSTLSHVIFFPLDQFAADADPPCAPSRSWDRLTPAQPPRRLPSALAHGRVGQLGARRPAPCAVSAGVRPSSTAFTKASSAPSSCRSSSSAPVMRAISISGYTGARRFQAELERFELRFMKARQALAIGLFHFGHIADNLQSERGKRRILAAEELLLGAA